MSSQDLFTVLQAKNDAELKQTLETLYTLQQNNPSRFRAFDFKIQKKGAHEQRRKDKFSQYEGPDHSTVNILARNDKSWTDRPCTFWSYSQRSVNSDSCEYPPRQLVEFYIAALRSDA